MKVVDWIDPCDKSPSPTPRDGRPADYMIYLHCSDLPQDEKDRLWDEAWEAVKSEIREKEYRFSGLQHIGYPKCVPVLDNGMTVDISARAWARLMFEAWHPGVEDKMGYAHYYNEVPQGEPEKLPTGGIES